MEEPFGFADIKIESIVTYSGDIYDCIHIFITRTYKMETINNAYFENKICLEKAHPDKIM